MDNLYRFLSLFPKTVATDLAKLPDSLWREGEELRLRKGHSAILVSAGKEYTISGNMLGSIEQELLNDIINKFLNYSDYAHLEELKSGYVSLQGGHRAGFSGQAVLDDGKIKLIRNITSINIRLARDVVDCGTAILPHLFQPDHTFGNTVIVSPPGCGKTTLLRSLIRQLSEQGFTISVCDERSEISGAGPNGYSFDLGPRTDILTGCSKEEGMMLMLRTMGPQILAADEIGTDREIPILQRALHSGVKLLITLHGSDFSDILYSPLKSFLHDGDISRIIFLNCNPRRGTVSGIWKKESMEASP